MLEMVPAVVMQQRSRGRLPMTCAQVRNLCRCLRGLAGQPGARFREVDSKCGFKVPRPVLPKLTLADMCTSPRRSCESAVFVYPLPSQLRRNGDPAWC